MQTRVQKLRLASQLIFFTIFLILMFTGKAQFWMALIFISIFLAAFFGRFYCGWICPIYTVIRPSKYISKKLKLHKHIIPDFFKSKLLRTIVFILFLIGLGYTIYTMRMGRKFPLPVIIITLGALTTLFLNENTWHRYLCPWGMLLTFTSRFSKRHMKIDGCVSCRKCPKVCPSEAIEFDKKARIIPKYCLVCFKCHDVCPVNVIHYRKDEK